jgi:ubiquinone/menaquinone biosynthesis C-methylase UbiE
MDIKGFEDTIGWYDKNAEKYANSTEQHASPEQIKEFVDSLPSNAKVLDAGCGGGRDTKLLQEAGTNTTGLDLSSGLINEAKKRHPEINFVQGSFLELPFDDSSFDGVWAHASLLHLEKVEDVKKALSEFNRVLNPNGVLHILVKAQTGDEKTAVVSDSLSGHDRFFQYFTQEELQRLLQEQGFESTKIEQYKETDKSPQGRPEVEWILSLSKKAN